MESVSVSIGDQLRTAAIARGEEFLAEAPRALRRLGMLFAALAISVPLFFAGCLAALVWFAIH